MAIDEQSLENLDAVVRHATFSVDCIAMDDYPTEAARTRALVHRTLEMALHNGLIKITDPETWPMWIIMDPPYTSNQATLVKE